MHISRTTVFGLAGLVGAVVLSATLMAGGQGARKGTPPQMPMNHQGMMMTKDQKIRNATTAAPASVSAKATILDWPAKEGAAPTVLRAGTNGWNCLPDMPDTEGNDPMCIDESWMKWVDAYMAHKAPHISTVGIGYMIAAGGGWGSNTDPYAMSGTKDNQWGLHPPHLMILSPDVKSLEGISTDPNNGGPYVMYKGTPYAHIMAPIAPAAMGGHSAK
jgi:hypothetical protein